MDVTYNLITLEGEYLKQAWKREIIFYIELQEADCNQIGNLCFTSFTMIRSGAWLIE